MTPTEEAAKLAKQLAEDVLPMPDMFPGNEFQQECYRKWEQGVEAKAAKFLPRITAAFAERDEELKRLREAAKEVVDVMDECGLSSEIGPTYTPLYRLKAALQPKEPNNEIPR